MKTISVRKIILFSAIFVLSVVLIVQVSIGGKGTSRIITSASPVDCLVITKADSSVIEVFKTGDIWTVGSPNSSAERKPADQTALIQLISAAEHVQVLGVVSSGRDDDKFGFDEAAPIIVEVKSGGKTLHRLVLGKTASASSQSYIRVDNSREVLLVSRDYRNIFDVTVESLQIKEEVEE